MLLIPVPKCRRGVESRVRWVEAFNDVSSCGRPVECATARSSLSELRY